MGRILVVGDVMLDEYVHGRVERMSPEAATPVFVEERREYLPGGAANVATGIDALGGRFSLFGVVGASNVIQHADTDGNTLRSMLESCIGRGSSVRIVTDDMSDGKRRTTKKTRFVTHTGQLLRVDVEDTFDVSDYCVAKLVNESENPHTRERVGMLAHAMKLDKHMLHDVIVISDYAKGFVTRELCAWITRWNQICNKARVIVDPKRDDWSRYRGAWLITPNQKEMDAALMLSEKSSDSHGIRSLMARHEIENCLMTQSEHGMTLYRGGEATHFPAVAREVVDVTGAGDTVVAAIATCLAAHPEHTLEMAIEFANLAAGVAVSRRGTHAVTIEEMKASEDFARIFNQWRFRSDAQ